MNMHTPHKIQILFNEYFTWTQSCEQLLYELFFHHMWNSYNYSDDIFFVMNKLFIFFLLCSKCCNIRPFVHFGEEGQYCYQILAWRWQVWLRFYWRFEVFTAVTMKDTIFLHSMHRLLVTADVVPSSPILVTLMMEVLRPPKNRFFQEPRLVTSQKTLFCNDYR
jgi:hypothetical protein